MTISLESSNCSPFLKDLLSIPEAVQYAGLSASTLWRYIDRGLLPKVQHGGPGTRVLLRRTDLLAVAPEAVHAQAVPAVGNDLKPAKKLSGRRPAWKQTNPKS